MIVDAWILPWRGPSPCSGELHQYGTPGSGSRDKQLLISIRAAHLHILSLEASRSTEEIQSVFTDFNVFAGTLAWPAMDTEERTIIYKAFPAGGTF